MTSLLCLSCKYIICAVNIVRVNLPGTGKVTRRVPLLSFLKQRVRELVRNQNELIMFVAIWSLDRCSVQHPLHQILNQ